MHWFAVIVTFIAILSTDGCWLRGSGNTYRFSVYIDQTAAGTSCAGTTTITPNLTFTDPNASSGFPNGMSNALISGNGAPGANRWNDWSDMDC